LRVSAYLRTIVESSIKAINFALNKAHFTSPRLVPLLPKAALPARHAHRDRRLGPVQRDRGRRPRRAHRQARLPDGRAGIDDVGGGAAGVPGVADAAHPLAQGLDADLSGAHAPAAATQPRARPARRDRLSRADGRADRLGSRASRILWAARLLLAVGR